MSEPRKTADTITDDDLDALYRRIETLEHVAAGNKRHVQLIVPELENCDAARRVLRERAKRAEEWAEATAKVGTRNMVRAEQAEAAIARVRERAEQWQAAMIPGERNPAAQQVLHLLDELSPAATEATEAAAPALRQQLRAAIEPTLLEYPEHNRTDEHEELLGEIVTAVLAAILPATRTTAALARRSEADVQRVIALYEQWVKAGPPPLGTLMSRWWDARLVELHEAILPPTT